MASRQEEVYCTACAIRLPGVLLIADVASEGAMVLAHSLRDNGTKKRLAVLVTLDSLDATTIEELQKLYDDIIPVDRILNKSPANLYLMNRPDLASTFTKIALWKQTQFRKIVYIDADIVVLRAPDELFKLDTPFAAVPDIGWPDCFNSGVLVLSPNLGDYYALLALAQRGISFDGADQGMLNMHFRDWHRLSFTYNCTPSGNYQYVPAYRHFQSSISMVHYIGPDKPWSIGREGGGSGVYDELLGRWWAVYDRHYRAASAMYLSGQSGKESRTVQQYVAGEVFGAEYGFSSNAASEDSGTNTEPPLTENIERSESIQQGEAKPPSTVQQRRFSAPMTEWDPVHAPPPTKSRPEASNFPKETYTMSSDPKFFQAPSAYPQPPKDMYYQVPKTPPAAEPPKPIFPWEQHRSKPARVFPEDKPPSPQPSVTSPSITTDDDTVGPSTPATQSSAEPFASYTHTNAWDDVPEIEHYISALQHHRRAKVQVLVNTATPTEPLLSPDAAPTTPKERRPSVKLTDFPTEIERPSLPVTPAPVRRPSFWSEERDEAGDLPAAEGVPKQEHWNPVAKLEELQRRQSEVLGQGPPMGQQRDIPDRKLPGVATPVQKDDLDGVAQRVEELDFGARNVERSGEDEGVFSATE